MPRGGLWNMRMPVPKSGPFIDDINGCTESGLDQQFLEALAHDPATLKRTWQSVKEIMAPRRTRSTDKEMVYLAVSATNHAHTASHLIRQRRKRPNEQRDVR